MVKVQSILDEMDTEEKVIILNGNDANIHAHATRTGIVVATSRGWFVSNWNNEPVQAIMVKRIE